jgi:hypothetical protein
MNTTKVIVTLLILTIVLSVVTIAFNAVSGGKTVVNDSKRADTATIGLYIDGAQAPAAQNANVGLSVVG